MAIRRRAGAGPRAILRRDPADDMRATTTTADRGRLAALAATLALAAPAASADLPEHPAILRGPAAAWVAPAGEPPPAPASASAFAYLRIDDQLLADGAATAAYAERVVEVLSQQGLDPAAQWEITFDPASQRLRVHALEVRRDGAWHDRLATAQSSVLQREPELGRQVYDESLTLLLVAEDVRVGDVVRIAYTVEGLNPILGGRYAGGFRLGWGIPVAEQRVRAAAPAGRPLHHRLHGEGAPPPERSLEGDRQILTWHLRDLPAIEVEPNAPPGWFTHPWVQLSQFADWAEVAEWGRALYPPQPPPPEIAAAAAAIAEAHPDDPGARLVAAARWVQDEIRYYAIALGPHSHEPHDLATIARRRYGDCKDKSRLLVGLLAALGIEAWPAFVDVDSGHRLDEWQPSPFAFDHVVVAARLGGERVWIDPTLELQGGSARDLWFPAYGFALELLPGVDSLTAIPPEPSLPGTTSTHYDYRLAAAGEAFEVTIETTHVRSGAEQRRRWLAATTAEELLDGYVDYYTDGERTVEPLGPLEIADDRDANRLVITERYRVDGCWEARDPGLACDLLPLTLAGDLIDPDDPDRRTPLDLPRDLVNRETVSIRASTPWEFQPVEEELQNPWFDFAVTSTPGDDSIELVYELRTKTHEVEPAEVGRYAEALREVIDSTGYTLTLEGTAGGSAGAAEDTGDGQDDDLSPWVPFGCGLLLMLLAGLFLGAVVLIIVLYRRRRRRGAGPPAPTPPRPPLSA